MASSQVEAASSVHEITDQAEEITSRPCCAQGQKPETTTEEPKVDFHDDDDDEVVGVENKEYPATDDELFKDDEDEYPKPNVADSPAVSEEKTVPSYGNKVNDPEDDDDDDHHDHDDEDDEEMI